MVFFHILSSYMNTDLNFCPTEEVEVSCKSNLLTLDFKSNSCLLTYQTAQWN